jgi:hypothetical protein
MINCSKKKERLNHFSFAKYYSNVIEYRVGPAIVPVLVSFRTYYVINLHSRIHSLFKYSKSREAINCNRAYSFSSLLYIPSYNTLWSIILSISQSQCGQRDPVNILLLYMKTWWHWNSTMKSPTLHSIGDCYLIYLLIADLHVGQVGSHPDYDLIH